MTVRTERGEKTGMEASMTDYTISLPSYSIGASGAVYGIMGTMLVLMLFQRERGDNSMLVRLGIFALYMFYTIVRSDGSIDHAAHIGGFVAGSVIGVVICILLRRKARKRLLKFRGGKD